MAPESSGRHPEDVTRGGNPQSQDRAIGIGEVRDDLVDLEDYAVVEPGIPEAIESARDRRRSSVSRRAYARSPRSRRIEPFDVRRLDGRAQRIGPTVVIDEPAESGEVMLDAVVASVQPS